MNRGHAGRFAEVQHAENIGETTKRIWTYFAKEKPMLISMLSIVVFGTLCGVYAPSLQSRAIDIIAGSTEGLLLRTVLLMLAVYLIYGVSQLLQSLISARLSQRIVKRMREEFFGKIIDLPVQYLDTHSHGDEASFEFIVSMNPEYIFVMDRDAATGTNEAAKTVQEIMENELVMSTDAYKNGNLIILARPDVWYTGEGGITALDLMLQDLENALLTE